MMLHMYQVNGSGSVVGGQVRAYLSKEAICGWKHLVRTWWQAADIVILHTLCEPEFLVTKVDMYKALSPLEHLGDLHAWCRRGHQDVQ